MLRVQMLVPGVKFCVGHGQGAFSWTVAEIAMRDGLLPDSISTDLHMGCINGVSQSPSPLCYSPLAVHPPPWLAVHSASLAVQPNRLVLPPGLFTSS